MATIRQKARKLVRKTGQRFFPVLHRQWQGWRGPPNRSIRRVAKNILDEQKKFEHAVWKEEFRKQPASEPQDYQRINKGIERGLMAIVGHRAHDYAYFRATKAALDLLKINNPAQRRAVLEAADRIAELSWQNAVSSSSRSGQPAWAIKGQQRKLDAVLGPKASAFGALVGLQYVRISNAIEEQLLELDAEEARETKKQIGEGRKEYFRLFGRRPPGKR